MCTIEEMEKEQSPAQAKAPQQKRRAVIRVESTETQDDVSEPQELEERERDEEEMEELSFIPSQRAGLGHAHVRQQMQRRGLQALPTCGHCDRRRSSA